MKKTVGILIAFVFLLVGVGYAQQWHTANQFTVAWDAVSTDINGDPLPVGDQIQYRIYLSNAVTDPGKANPALVDTTDQLTYTVTLNTEGKYFIGLETVRLSDDGSGNFEEVSNSVIGWSDDINIAPDPFGLRYFLPPAAVINLRPA